MKIRVFAVALWWVVGCAEGPPGPQGPQGPEGRAGQPWSVGSGLELSGEELRARYGSTGGTVVEGDDPRLSDARMPLPDSDAYIRNGVEVQAGHFALSGKGHTVGPLSTQTRLEVDAGFPAASDAALLQVLNTDPGAALWIREPMFQVRASGMLVAGGKLGIGGPPPSGQGERLLWDPYKGALRAGSVSADQWDQARIGFYSTATGFNTIASGQAAYAGGQDNQALGRSSTALGEANVASGTASTALGLDNEASGMFSVALGGRNVASGVEAVAIGSRTLADGNNSLVMGRYASSGGFSGGFTFGDASTSSVLAPTANNQFLVRAVGGIRLRTSTSLSNGCDLAPGGGTFSCTSDRNLKEDLRNVDGEALLSRVSALPIQSWRYREEPSGARHLGPMAQDFRAAFGLGSDEVSIGLLDIAGVNMAAIQALERRTQQLQERTAEVEVLKARLARLEQLVSRLEQAGP